MGFEGQVLKKLNTDVWVKLVCCVYLLKHKTFNSEPIESLYKSLTATSLTEEKQQLLKWLAYSKVQSLKTLAEWHDFTRRVCFHHSSGSKDHEALFGSFSECFKISYVTIIICHQNNVFISYII